MNINNPRKLEETEYEELIRLRAEIKYIKAENAVIKKDCLERRKADCATQGEKAAIFKELKEKGYQLKHFLKAMGMAKSTYYFEINKIDVVSNRNVDMESDTYIMNWSTVDIRLITIESNVLCTTLVY